MAAHAAGRSRHKSLGSAALDLAAGPFVPILATYWAPRYDAPLGGQREDLSCRCYTTANATVPSRLSCVAWGSRE